MTEWQGTANHLFNTKLECKKLPEDKTQIFDLLDAKPLYCQDIRLKF